MHLNSTPATRIEILSRAVSISFCPHSVVCALSDEWYHRFMKFYSEMTNSQAQTISRIRSACTYEVSHSVLFYAMAKLVIEYRLDASHIFNMDETSFLSAIKAPRWSPFVSRNA